MLTDKEQKIARPRQIYIGHQRRDYATLGQRNRAAAAAD
jgi:citrate synthase